MQNAKEGDTLVFQYSGHGTQVRDQSKDETDRKDEAICTLEKNGTIDIILDDELKEMLAKIPAGVRVLNLMDCCHSKSIFDLANIIDNSNARSILDFYSTKEKEKSRSIFDLLDNKQKRISASPIKAYVSELSGCEDEQTSADDTIDQKRQGAMTASFLAMVEQYKGLKNIFNIFFSSNVQNMAMFQSKIGNWLHDREYTQTPRISFEGVLPAPTLAYTRALTPMLNSYQVGGGYPLRASARQNRGYIASHSSHSNDDTIASGVRALKH